MADLLFIYMLLQDQYFCSQVHVAAAGAPCCRSTTWLLLQQHFALLNLGLEHQKLQILPSAADLTLAERNPVALSSGVQQVWYRIKQFKVLV